MALFDFKPKSTKESDILTITKSSKKSSSPVKLNKGETLSDKIKNMRVLVEKHLGKFRDEYVLIKEEEDLINYLRVMAKDGLFAIDTETTSLDAITCTLVGVSLYSLSNKPAYIPLNHISNMTGMRLTNQLTVEQFSKCFKQFYNDKMKPVFFNAKFDMRVLYHQADFKDKDGNYLLKPYFDGFLAQRCLNENEVVNKLKNLYTKYCLNGKGDAFSFGDLFKGIPFNYVPIDTAYLYAAHDAFITYKLFEYQKQFLDTNNDECIKRDLQGVANIFNEIEMPIIPIVARMQDNGISIDISYQQSLAIKYDALLKEKKQEFYDIVKMYDKEIEKFMKENPGHKLQNPINLNSPLQVAELFYDVIGLKNGQKRDPRGTGEKCIEGIDHPAAKTLLEYREFEKLMSTYITKMPECLNPKTGRIHCSFNQYGTDTGRFSSSDPNMQNIPSKNKDVRPMFCASPGCVFLFSDYSKQEAVLAAVMSNDAVMLKGIEEGKDIYSIIAAVAFELEYEECCEKHPDGTVYKEGKSRRDKAKAIVLGVMYSKGIKAIAEDLNVSQKIAQRINDTIMATFPGLQTFMDESQQMAIDYGYVTTYWGRKRRLPDMQLQPYEFTWVNGLSNDFDPLEFGSSSEISEVPIELQEKYTRLLQNAYGYKAKQPILEMAKAENIKIKDNTFARAEAERKCVNSRVQGSAADLTKLAIRFIGENQKLKDLGFKLILCIHDELVGECPRENAKECSELFATLMSEAGLDLGVRLKCDVEITERWYGEEIKL
jgi:DNA polymerase I-like protein with 3'-5' exonuclease and polymerase domains